MARKIPGPLDTIAVRLSLGPDWGPRFEAVAERNSRTLTGELTQATRAWVVQQEAQQHPAAGQPTLPVVLP
jgi:hypothetical protein